MEQCSAAAPSFSMERSHPPPISLNNLGRPGPSHAPASPPGSQVPGSGNPERKKEMGPREEVVKGSKGRWAAFVSLGGQPAMHRVRRLVGSLANGLWSISSDRVPWTPIRWALC